MDIFVGTKELTFYGLAREKSTGEDFPKTEPLLARKIPEAGPLNAHTADERAETALTQYHGYRKAGVQSCGLQLA